MTSAEDVDETSMDQLCENCGLRLGDHVAYLTDVPENMVEGVFELDVTGLYCPPETVITVAPLWEDVEPSADFL